MSPTTKNLHTTQSPPEKIAILLVSPYVQDADALRQILRHRDWDICQVADCYEAAKHLRTHAASVVICERDLPDGDWRDVLHLSMEADSAPLLLVVSRYADEKLWAEVLNLGGYDVLLKPFDKSEVTRVIGMAWRHWRSSCLGGLARAAALSTV